MDKFGISGQVKVKVELKLKPHIVHKLPSTTYMINVESFSLSLWTLHFSLRTFQAESRRGCRATHAGGRISTPPSCSYSASESA